MLAKVVQESFFGHLLSGAEGYEGLKGFYLAGFFREHFRPRGTQKVGEALELGFVQGRQTPCVNFGAIRHFLLSSHVTQPNPFLLFNRENAKARRINMFGLCQTQNFRTHNCFGKRT